MSPSMWSLSSSLLPMDLLLEISACSDPVTLVRSAATCKVLRRHIADPTFHRRLRLSHSDRFVPRLLRGFFMQKNKGTDGYENPRFLDLVRPTQASPPKPFNSFLSKFDTLFHVYGHDLAASGGLVALRADPPTAGLSLFNPMTGYVQLFDRPPGINAQSFALLTGDHGHGLYCLLAAELAPGLLKTQALSQADDKWLAVQETTVAPCPQDAELLHRPLVLEGDVVHWLCRSSEYHFILRFSFSPTQARSQAAVSVTKVDGSCGEQLLGRRREELLLVSDGSGHGRQQPRLLVAAGLQISLCTWSGDGEASCWSMQVMVGAETIQRPAGAWSERLELRWFGDKSGMVLVRMEGAQQESSPSWYFVLELATRRVRGVCTGPHRDVVFFPYEMEVSFWRPTFPRQLH